MFKFMDFDCSIKSGWTITDKGLSFIVFIVLKVSVKKTLEQFQIFKGGVIVGV